MSVRDMHPKTRQEKKVSQGEVEVKMSLKGCAEVRVKSSQAKLCPVTPCSPGAVFYVPNTKGFLFGAENMRGKEDRREDKFIQET